MLARPAVCALRPRSTKVPACFLLPAHKLPAPLTSLPTLPPPCSFDEFGRPRKKESAADREAREKAALDRLNVS